MTLYDLESGKIILLHIEVCACPHLQHLDFKKRMKYSCQRKAEEKDGFDAFPDRISEA